MREIIRQATQTSCSGGNRCMGGKTSCAPGANAPAHGAATAGRHLRDAAVLQITAAPREVKFLVQDDIPSITPASRRNGRRSTCAACTRGHRRPPRTIVPPSAMRAADRGKEIKAPGTGAVLGDMNDVAGRIRPSLRNISGLLDQGWARLLSHLQREVASGRFPLDHCFHSRTSGWSTFVGCPHGVGPLSGLHCRATSPMPLPNSRTRGRCERARGSRREIARCSGATITPFGVGLSKASVQGRAVSRVP